jgi:methionyl-tRNA formyltransferase
MGTPDFAVASLAALQNAGHQIVAVVTSPDKPAGRGQKLRESAVKQYATTHQLKVLQPEKLKSPEFIEELRSLNADLQIVVAFRMLPEVVWNMPPMGTINLHASLLPQYRGAAPINHAIINGEKMTGVSTFLLQHEIDTGSVIFSETTEIGDEDNAGTLHDRLMEIGARLIVKTVQAVAEGNYTATPQTPSDELKAAPKIFKEFCQINWNQSNILVYNHIRGLSPYPAAFTTITEKTLKIFTAERINVKPNIAPGQFETDGKTYLQFASTDGFIRVLDVQLEGKKRMKIDEFLRGVRLN